MIDKSPQVLTFKPEPQRVLLILPTWVGDVVMATPFIEALFKRFATAEISLLMHRHLLPLLEGSPWAARCYFWPSRQKSKEASRAQRMLLKTLRQQQFDLAIMLPNSFRSALICWRVAAKRRVGFKRDGRGLLLTDALAAPNKISNIAAKKYAPMPLVKYYAYLAQALGCEHPGDALTLFTTTEDDQVVARRLARANATPGRAMVVICPGANFGASKCWDPQRFASVADRLVEQHGAIITISPGPGEELLAQAIQDAMQQPSLLLTNPCLTLGQLKSLIRDSDLLLGNDTGPRHFARAFDINRVTVFGPTEAKWTDTSHGGETIVRVDVPCGPCHKKVCPLEQQICMQRVTVDMVTHACAQALSNNEA